MYKKERGDFMVAIKLRKLTAILAASCMIMTSAFGTIMTSAANPEEPVNLIAGKTGTYVFAKNNTISAGNITQGGNSSDKLTDGDKTVHCDLSGQTDSQTGVLFDLGKYYDISQISAITKKIHNQYMVSEVTVYAAKSLDELYQPDSIISKNKATLADVDTTHDLGKQLESPVTAQYVAFFCTELQSTGIRLCELEIFGTLSAEQPPSNVMLAENNWTGKAPAPKEVKSIDNTFTQIQDASYSYSTGGTAAFTDGNTATHIDIMGGIPDGSAQIRGLQYDLKGYYDVSQFAVHVWNGDQSIMIKDVYIFASEKLEDLYKQESLLAQITGDTRAEKCFSLQATKKVRYVTFFMFAPGSYPRVRELEVYGKARPDEEQPAPPPPNILTTAQGIGKPMPYYDPAGKFNSEFSVPQYPDDTGVMQPTFASVLKGISLDGFADGNYNAMVQIYGGMPDDKTRQGRPVVIYDLGKYYDITGAAMYVGGSIQKVRIYASGSLEKITYYDNLIYADEEDSSAPERQVTLDTPKKVRYVAFCLAKKAKNGGWQASEFEVYGTLSEDQETPPAESNDPQYPGEGGGDEKPTESDNLLFELTPDEVGLAKKDTSGNYDFYTLSSVGGTKNWTTQLTDAIIADSEGYYQNVQLWAGDKEAATHGGKYVLIYDLEAYFNLTDVAVQATPAPGTQLLAGWDVYAGNDTFTLFSDDNKIGSTAVTSSETYKKLSVSAAGVRYIAYVFSQVDTEYGAARISEIEAYGVKSGDIEPEPETGNSHLTLENAETGVTVWVYALEDEVEPEIEGTLSVTELTDTELFSNVYRGLDRRYGAEKLYRIEILDEFDEPIELDGRKMRVFFPISEEMKGKKDLNFALVDDTEVDLINGFEEDDCFVFDTNSYVTLAVVSREGKAFSGGDNSGWNWGDSDIPATAVAVSVLTFMLFAVSISLVVVTQKKRIVLSWVKRK